VGLDQADDAGVYKITDDLAIIQTVDFFTPIVDDPYWFGQIAAANALSDVYAMGGVPKTAMNLVAFPIKDMDISMLISKTIPIIPETLEYAGMGLVPAGTYNNREFREGMVDFAPSVDSLVQDVLFDSQTSGGLLICVDRENADELLEKLRQKGMDNAAIIGDVATEPKGRIVIT